MEKDPNVWVVQGPREKILEFLERKPQSYTPANIHSLMDNIDTNKLFFIWHEKPTETAFFPNFILGEKSNLDDLFSWSATYLRNLGPLSAQARIATYKWFAKAVYEKHSALAITTDQTAIGLIIAEVSYLAKKIINAEDISVAACQSTLSFALTKSLNSDPENILELPDYWLKAKSLTDQKHASINIAPIVRCFLSIIKSEGKVTADISVADILTAIREGKKIDPERFSFYPHHLLRSYSQDFYNLSSEERLKVYDLIGEHIALKASIPNEEKAFFIALFAALCRPGVFETISLLSPFINQFPEALLWYGIIQSTFPKNDIFACGNGLGWRLARDLRLKEYMFDLPRCDISLMELEIYSRLKTGFKSIKSETRSRLIVELLPGINGIFKTADKEIEVQDSSQLSLANLDLDKRSILHHEMLSEIEKNLLKSLKTVEIALGRNPESKNQSNKKKPSTKKGYWKS